MIGACLSSPGTPMSHLQFYPEFQEWNITSYENYFLESLLLCHDICPERDNKFFQNIGNSYPFQKKARRKECWTRSDGRYILGREDKKFVVSDFPESALSSFWQSYVSKMVNRWEVDIFMSKWKNLGRGFIAYDRKLYIGVGRALLEGKFYLTLRGLYWDEILMQKRAGLQVWHKVESGILIQTQQLLATQKILRRIRTDL